MPALHTQPALFWGQGEGMGGGQVSWEPGQRGWSRHEPQALDGSLGQLQRPNDLWLLFFLSPSYWQAILDKWG